jgi:hypothetical protein
MKLKINESGDSIWIKEEEKENKTQQSRISKRRHGLGGGDMVTRQNEAERLW